MLKNILSKVIQKYFKSNSNLFFNANPFCLAYSQNNLSLFLLLPQKILTLSSLFNNQCNRLAQVGKKNELYLIFLYDNGLCHERVKNISKAFVKPISQLHISQKVEKDVCVNIYHRQQKVLYEPSQYSYKNNELRFHVVRIGSPAPISFYCVRVKSYLSFFCTFSRVY